MPVRTRRNPARIYDQADQFAADLEARQEAAAQEMLAAWSDRYWAIRTELDTLAAKVQAARAAGIPTSPAWGYQQQRLKALLDATKVEVHRYADDAAQATSRAQEAAIRAAAKHAERMGKMALSDEFGLDATFTALEPRALLENAVGFTGAGGVLQEHLRRTLADDTVERIRATLLHGLATGRDIPWMVRQVTSDLALTHSRATTIMRTETQRVYRETTRQTYAANADVLGGWIWRAHLDGRTCAACVVMDGTEHGLDETLDGHPRCRCAMIPRTKTWDELGIPGLPDTRPPVRSGKAWLESQPPHVQQAIMGPGKWKAWQEGGISLDDLVARHHHPDWGTMRSERSLKAITEGRNANWFARPEPPAPPRTRTHNLPRPPAPSEPIPAPAVPPVPEPTPPPNVDLPFSGTDPKTLPSRVSPADLARAEQTAVSVEDDVLNRWAIDYGPGGDLADNASHQIILREQAFRTWLETADEGSLRAYKATVEDATTTTDRLRLQRVNDALERRFWEPPWPTLAEAEDWEKAMGAVNPRYSEGMEWQHNCTNCSTTYELRRRGFDVRAQSRRKGRSLGDTFSAWGVKPGEWMPQSTWLQAEKAMRLLPEGARGVVTCQWKGGGAHIFNWEVQGGQVKWIDAQPNWTYTTDRLRERAKAKVWWARLDDKPVRPALSDYLLDFSTDPTTRG